MLSEVYSSLRPLFVFSSLTGMFFLDIDSKTSRMKTTMWNKVSIIITLVFYIIGSWYYFKCELIEKLFSTKLSRTGANVLLVIDFTFIISAMLWIYTQRGGILKILIKFDVNDFLKLKIICKLFQ